MSVVIASVARRFMVVFLSAIRKALRYARNRGRARAATPVPSAPATQAKIYFFKLKTVPADGTRAATSSKRGLRYVAVFGQPTDKILFAHACHMGCRRWRTMGVEELIRG